MVTLYGELNFWSLCNDLKIKASCLSCKRFYEKDETLQHLYINDRKEYFEARGSFLIAKNSRPNKFKENLKEFQDILNKEKVIHQEWQSFCIYRMFFSTGLVISLEVNPYSGDLVNILIDKYLVGKLPSEHVANDDLTVPVRFSGLDPKVQTYDIAGPVGRRFERKLSSNIIDSLIVVWWHTSDDEVYPWSPLARDRDRANILVYRVMPSSLDLVCYCRTELPPLSVSFSVIHSNVILTVEQGFDKKGNVTVLSCIYEIKRGAVHRFSVKTINIEAPVTAYAYHPSEEHLLLACNNGVLALHSDNGNTTHVTKASLIVSSVSWLHSGSLVAVSNDRGQIQLFDMALSLIRVCLKSEAVAPQRILDISEFFPSVQTLSKISWLPKHLHKNSHYISSSLLLFLYFSKGLTACLCFEGCSSVLSLEMLVHEYVKHRQYDEAVNMYLLLNWDHEGMKAMKCLSVISKKLLQEPLNAQRESNLEALLGSFYAPLQPFSHAVEDEFGPEVRAITRKFFFKVLRSGMIEKAYRLSIDLKDHDCFKSVSRVAQMFGNTDIAAMAEKNAAEIENEWFSCSSRESCIAESGESLCSSSCSESCSTCSGSDSDKCDGICDGEHNEDVTKDPCNDIRDAPSNFRTEEPLPRRSEIRTLTSESKISKTATAITAPDGTITINIREPAVMPVPPKPPRKLTGQASINSRLASEVFGPSAARISKESAPVSLAKLSLSEQYKKAILQETTTEEEDGRTVKVVHFGIV